MKIPKRVKESADNLCIKLSNILSKEEISNSKFGKYSYNDLLRIRQICYYLQCEDLDKWDFIKVFEMFDSTDDRFICFSAEILHFLDKLRDFND